jgi:plasmid rolling circle replication initiator protein Rep
MPSAQAALEVAEPAVIHLTDVSPSDKPWDHLKARADRVSKLLSDDLDLIAHSERVADCSRWLRFSLVPTVETVTCGTFRHKLTDARFCRVNLCPVCSWRKQLAWRGRFFKAVPKIRESYPTARWLFVTLTVENVPVDQLGRAITDMNTAWNRLRNRKTWPALGYLRALEVTRETKRPDFAHPHFHAMLLVPASYFSTGYIKQADWREMWKASLRVNYEPSVNVKAIKPKAVDPDDPNSDGLTEAVLSCLSYHVKGAKSSNLYDDAPWFNELFKQMRRVRTVSVGGVLRDHIRDDEPEDLIHLEDSPDEPENDDISFWYQWRRDCQRYTLRN